MIGYQHTIIVIAGALGLLLGGVLVDTDHRGTWEDKWRGYWRLPTKGPCNRGVLHNPVVMLSLASFFMMLGIGLLLHYMGDFIYGMG